MPSRKDQAVPTTNTKNKNIITASKAKALSAVPSTPTSTLLNDQEHLRHEPVITLASLRALREESPRQYFESLTSNADSRSSSYPVAIQVMTISGTSIEEQLAQMIEAIVRPTRIMKEKNLQIATLINRLEA
ncbi:hypothetical protein PS2_000254 [Malus domestica]